MRDALRVVARTGIAGPLALGMLGCSLLLALALVAAAALARPGAGRALRALAWAEAACGGAALALGLALAAAARRRLAEIEHPFGAFGQGDATAWAAAFEQSESALVVTGAAMAVVAALLAAAVILWQARTGAGALRAATHLSAALLLGVTAVGVARHAHMAKDWPPHCGRNITWCLQEMRPDIARPLDQARLHVLGLAAASAVVLAGAAAWGRLRDERAARRRVPVGAALVLLSGIAAHRATMGMASDTGLDMRLREDGEADCPVPEPLARALPPASRCDGWFDGPALHLAGGRASLDGADHTPETAGRALADKRALLAQVLGRAHRLPPLWLTILAPASTPIADIVPYLAAIRDNLGPDVVIVGVRPDRTVRTRTLGDLVLGPRCCATPIRLDPGGAPASTFATWGDLSRAAAGAERRLDVAIP